MSTAVARPRTWRLIPAFLLSLALALGGVVAGASAPARAAEGPSVAVSKAPIAGGTVTVTGVGFTPDATGIYVGLGAAGAPHFYATEISGSQWLTAGNGLDEDGSFAVELNVPALSEDALAVYTSKAHGRGEWADVSQNVSVVIEYETSSPSDPEPTPEPGGSVPDAPVPGEDEDEAPAPEAPTVEVSKTTDLKAGEVITVRGSGFGDPSVVGTRPPLAGKFAGTYVVVGSFPEEWQPSKGISSKSRTIHDEKWVVNEPELSLIGGTEAGGVAINPDGTFELQLTVEKPLGAPEGTNFGVYTYPGSGAKSTAFETYTPLEFAPEATGAVLEVSKTSGLNPDGEELVISGSGYEINDGGMYAQIGWIIEGAWTPLSDKDTRSENRANVKSAWVGSGFPGQPVWTTAEDGSGSFTWTVTIDKATLEAKRLEGGTLAVFTLGAHGNWVQPANERFVPISFADEVTGAVLEVSKTSGLNPEGEEIVVSGSGYEINDGGIYAQVGWIIEDSWTPLPNDDTRAANRASVESAWIGSGFPGQPTWTMAEDGTGSFAWTVEIDKASLEAKRLEGGTLAVFTLGAHGNWVQPANERFVPISFADDSAETPEEPGTPAPQPNPTPKPQPNPGAETPAVASGSLVWGVKASFRSYISNQPGGQISVSGATSSGGAFVFGQRGVSSFDQERGTGTVSYNGSVRFTGHGGVLDLTFANPSVTVVSGSSAHLYVTINGARVHLANLNLAAASKSVVNGATTFRNVPATLTAGGASAFNGFYGAGESLDSVTFTVGAAATSTPGTAVVASASTTPATTRTPAPTPPATSGVTIEGVEDGDVLQPGSEVTITADGFQPNEDGILVVIYSEPTVLDRNATADANGRVTWTGALPADLTGEHTLTLQGSVTRGVVVTIDELMSTTSIGLCEATDAQLTWGFKEAFRAYLTSTIASGEWTVADGATYEVPNFGWEGDGNYDTNSATGELTFAGSVNFTGHGGVLNTTIANPRIEFIDENSAELFLDVIGETQDGETVNDAGVLFATIDLTGSVEESDGTVTVTDAPATLTEEGSAAFGTYEPNTELDPITLTFNVDPDCGATAGGTPTEGDTEDTEVTPISDENDTAWLPWALLAAVLIIAIVVITILARRKKD